MQFLLIALMFLARGKSFTSRVSTAIRSSTGDEIPAISGLIPVFKPKGKAEVH